MKELSDINLACVITTYSRADEAKAQMDIIRELWQPHFGRIDIYHEFNGKKAWYPKKYREDHLFRHAPKPHFEGAVYLIEQGIEHVLNGGGRYDFIVVASADVWLYDPDKIIEIIVMMKKGHHQLATSVWTFSSLSTEFFVITPALARKVFPLDYVASLKKYRTVRLADSYSHSRFVNLMPWSKIAVVEMLFTRKVLSALKGNRRILLIPGRRFVFVKNRFYSRDFYSSHHDAAGRKKTSSSTLKKLLQGKEIGSDLLKELIK